jgi:hypothetical protein
VLSYKIYLRLTGSNWATTDTAPKSRKSTVPPASTEYSRFLRDGVTAASAAIGCAKTAPAETVATCIIFLIALNEIARTSVYAAVVSARCSAQNVGLINTPAFEVVDISVAPGGHGCLRACGDSLLHISGFRDALWLNRRLRSTCSKTSDVKNG